MYMKRFLFYAAVLTAVLLHAKNSRTKSITAFYTAAYVLIRTDL